jgi:hypothetical protein
MITRRPPLFLDLSLDLSLRLSSVCWCSLCLARRPECRLLNRLKSLVIRPIQQAISSQA